MLHSASLQGSHTEVSKRNCNISVIKRWGLLSPEKNETKRGLNCILLVVFRWLRDLKAIRYLQEETTCTIEKTTRASLPYFKISWTSVYKRRKMGQSFYPPSVNAVFCFIARLRKVKSLSRIQPNFATCWEVSQVCKCTWKIWGVLSLKNREAKTAYFEMPKQ